MDIKHYNQTPKRDADFIKPPNILKAKVGSGGLDESVLDRAQNVIEKTEIDFVPSGQAYLDNIFESIKNARANFPILPSDTERFIAPIIFPSAQLKANGAMFGFPLITRLADRLVQFLEVIETVDNDTLEITAAFHQTLGLVLNNKIKGDSGKYGDALADELNKACERYFKKT